MYIDIVRAWKDDEYRYSFTEGETPEGDAPVIPSNPAGDLGEGLDDKDLEKVQGGLRTSTNIIPACASSNDDPYGLGCETSYPCS